MKQDSGADELDDLRASPSEVVNPSEPRVELVPRAPAWTQLLARVLDDAIPIPGTSIRIGLDGIVGLFFPGAGDAAGAVASGALLLLGLRRGVPTVVLLRMLLVIALDAALGAVPVVGDVFDLAFKSNRRMLQILEPHLGAEPRKPRVTDYLVVGAAFVLLVLAVVLPLVLLVRALASLFGTN